MNKAEFKEKLKDIQEAYKSFLDEKVDIDRAKPHLSFKFSLFMNLVSDFHYGSLVDQTSAREVLQKLNIDKVNSSLLLPKKTLERILMSPESYASKVEYIDYVEECENDLLI